MVKQYWLNKMRNKQRKEKDPFEKHDKFWDDLYKDEDIKSDEDYFKDKHRQANKNQSTHNLTKEQIMKMIRTTFIIIFIGTFIIPLIFMEGLFVNGSFIIMGIIFFIVFMTLTQIKNKK